MKILLPLCLFVIMSHPLDASPIKQGSEISNKELMSHLKISPLTFKLPDSTQDGSNVTLILTGFKRSVDNKAVKVKSIEHKYVYKSSNEHSKNITVVLDPEHLSLSWNGTSTRFSTKSFLPQSYACVHWGDNLIGGSRYLLASFPVDPQNFSKEVKHQASWLTLSIKIEQVGPRRQLAAP